MYLCLAVYKSHLKDYHSTKGNGLIVIIGYHVLS